MKRLCALFLIFVPFPAHAGSAGTTAADFLQLGVGPRAVAMGEAQVGLADDVYATYWNPAGLSQLRTQEAGFVQTQYLENIQTEYLAYAYPNEHLGTFAGSLTYLNVGQFQGYDAAGLPAGTVGANDVALAFSYARPLWQNRRLASSLSAGVSGKWIQENLDTVTGRAYAFDGGLLFTPGLAFGEFFKGWRAGLVLRNAGTPLKFDQDSFALPRSLTAGVSWTGLWLDETITLAADAQQPNDGSRSMGIGAEVTTLDIIVLRAGYTTYEDIGNGVRAGVGLRLKTLQVDYSFSNGGDFGAIHRIGVTFRFGKKPEDPQAKAEVLYLKGIKEYKKSRFTDALVDFNKALEIDPSHPQALDMMHKTYDQLKTIAPDQ